LQVLHRILVRGDQVAFEPRCQLLATQQLIAPILSVIAIPVAIVVPTRIISISVVGGTSSATAASVLVVLVVAIAIVGSAATSLIAIPVAIATIVVLAVIAISVTIAGSKPKTYNKN